MSINKFERDYIIRGTAAGGQIRAFAAYTKNTVNKAKEFHNSSHGATAALGRALTANSIMTCFFKDDKSTLTFQIKGNGPLGGIVTVGKKNKDSVFVRGYVNNPSVLSMFYSHDKLNVGGLVGREGRLNVIKDMGLKEPYIGHIELVSGEIAEDLSHYFMYSEQIPSIVALGVLISPEGEVLESGGYIIQLMPDATEEVIKFLEEKIIRIDSISKMLSNDMTPEDILNEILGALDFIEHEKIFCDFKCNCNRNKMEKNLIALGKNELLKLISEQDEMELQCHFCNTFYIYTKEEIKNLL